MKRAVAVGLALLGCACARGARTDSATWDALRLQPVGPVAFSVEQLPGKVVLVDFFATWCGPCKVLEPVLDDLASGYVGKVKFVKVDIEERRAEFRLVEE